MRDPTRGTEASQQTAAFLTTVNEVDMSGALSFRKKHRGTILERHGVQLGTMGVMARASVLALKDIPAMNASIENGDTVVYRDYVDLSVAASIPKGPVTPALRNRESMSIVEIEKDIADLARDGKLTMDDLTGGSFTISNSGVWGSLFWHADHQYASDGCVGDMMYIAFTSDRRIIDGREAVAFLTPVKKSLEQPEAMLPE
ncbi:hypothetical protein N7492_001832 [Penicillium capsulatum]|uniref:dihydrolipoyllysine-residue succinyltransferase n=1 Tax=Penicillium capsulatum TaxID=69766 RepID=A0A9W9IYJ3_9EURO|nr:hypothetical protein N7492_001832 [Penicillium capsulatum]KAJ6129119.1 hypothetical protein N7512_001899 [Penicillium capsulatum]